MASSAALEDYLTLKSLWWYRHILDTDGTGNLNKCDFDRSALKYAILYCKGDKIKEFCDMFLNVFRQLWDSIKSTGIRPQIDNINFKEYRTLVGQISQQTKTYDELPDFWKKLIDMLFESYDSKGDNGIDVDEYRLYLCARNMDIKKATDCFKFMTGNEKTKIKKPEFRQLMYDFLTSSNPQTKGRYICGPFDSEKATTLQQYFLMATA